MPKTDALFVNFIDLNAGTSQERNQHFEREEASDGVTISSNSCLDGRNLYCLRYVIFSSLLGQAPGSIVKFSSPSILSRRLFRPRTEFKKTVITLYFTNKKHNILVDMAHTKILSLLPPLFPFFYSGRLGRNRYTVGEQKGIKDGCQAANGGCGRYVERIVRVRLSAHCVPRRVLLYRSIYAVLSKLTAQISAVQAEILKIWI
jgi:hypothetical protein